MLIDLNHILTEDKMKNQLTKARARTWLKAVRSMRDYYLGENDKAIVHCPFCDLSTRGCLDCLWEIFDSTGCERHARKHNLITPGISISQLRFERNEKWVKLSLSRLARWEKRLFEMLD